MSRPDISLPHYNFRIFFYAFGAMSALVLVLLGVLLRDPKTSIEILAAAAVSYALLKQPMLGVYLILALAPFYDICRAIFFPESQLLGAWQDVIVFFVFLGAVVRYAKGARPKLRRLDYAVLAFICLYAVSVINSPTLGVWFYGFRWVTVYAFLYLFLKFYTFRESQIKAMILLTIGSITLSGLVGLYGAWTVGIQNYVQGFAEFNIIAFGRANSFRWPATFTNPLVASIAFGLVSVACSAQILTHNKARGWKILLLFSLICVALTLSRSGLVISAVGIAATLWVVGEQKKWRKVILPVMFGLIVAIIAVPQLISVTRLFSLQDEWDQFRIGTFTTVISEAFTKYPFGTGAGTSGAVAIPASEIGGIGKISEDETIVGDSLLLQALRDTGWLGFFAYIAICIGVIVAGKEAAKTASPRLLPAALLSLGFCLALFVSLMNLADIFPLKVYYWLLAALAVAIAEGRVSTA
jgi:hypothetical protein